MSMTLSKHSMPSTPSCSPGFTRIRLSRFASALKSTSLTSVDLPDPDTPVTATKRPTGKSTSMPFRLCIVAPRRHRDAPLAAQELSRDRALGVRDRVGGALGDDLSPVLAGSGPHVHEPV